MSGSLEFGRIKDESGRFFVAGPPEAYDEVMKGLSGDKLHIIQLRKDDLQWLATNCLINLPLPEREGVLAGVDAILDEELEAADV